MKYFYILLFLILLCSFSFDKKTDNDVLPDSLFALKNIPSTDITNKFCSLEKNGWHWYTDSTKKTSFVKLDSIYKVRLLTPALKIHDDWINDKWVLGDMTAYFISKQEKVGDILPIVVYAGGTDYSALILITLDKNCNVVSSFILKGGDCGWPYCPVKHSYLNKDKISSYILNVSYRQDFMTVPSTIDSISYLSKISADGKIETKRLDSTRYERVYNWLK